MTICAAFMFFTTLLALCLRFLLVWENRQLDKKYGSKSEAADMATADASMSEDNYGARFRFAL